MKKVLRCLGLFVLIILASVGVGIVGGVPLSLNNKREEIIEVHVEAPDTEKEETTVSEFRV